MRFFLHGVHVPHRKNTAAMPAVKMPVPSEVTIPTAMHIGKPAIPCVKAGDEVFVGTLIAEQNGFVSAPVYSSVSGKVKSIVEVSLPSGATCPAIKIESDGNMTYDSSIEPPIVTDKQSLVEAIKKSGTVGLGGAGFPSYVKFNVPDGKKIDALIINGAECEPYITSDTRTMVDKSEDLYCGIASICEFLEITNVIIGIEANKTEAIASMRNLAARDERIKVAVLPSVYPQGGEKVLVYHTTGKVIPAGKLPLDVGVIVSNCTTVAAIGNYLKTGIPLVSKCVTVDGGSVTEPKNVIAPIGASVADVIDFAGGFKSEPYMVLLGGPMMGSAIESLDMPVMKNTNAILGLTAAEAKPKRETACIHCGACISHCPLSLNPRGYMYAYKNDDVEKLEKLRVDICMECGCCSFICPAGKPLVEINKLSKAKLRNYLAEKKAKEEACNGK
ncbi:MAG: electron transport complex subunit RsxC [Ruminococcaceae bacterium]|nr:electron transport complex subunit RsxC [Oscillospiraceae bacterium]